MTHSRPCASYSALVKALRAAQETREVESIILHQQDMDDLSAWMPSYLTPSTPQDGPPPPQWMSALLLGHPLVNRGDGTWEWRVSD